MALSDAAEKVKCREQPTRRRSPCCCQCNSFVVVNLIEELSGLDVCQEHVTARSAKQRDESEFNIPEMMSKRLH